MGVLLFKLEFSLLTLGEIQMAVTPMPLRYDIFC
jgi:hypothetical protein